MCRNDPLTPPCGTPLPDKVSVWESQLPPHLLYQSVWRVGERSCYIHERDECLQVLIIQVHVIQEACILCGLAWH